MVDVVLRSGVEINVEQSRRRFYVTSSCGVCGRASIEMLEAVCPRALAGKWTIPAGIVMGLPERLREVQPVFGRTGGLHAAALFDTAGTLISVREDVGRHNALDKLIGAESLARRLPLSDRVLLVSGRASFELVQKAVMAGIPAMVAVGAPSSLAVQTALRFGMTLAGFVRAGRFNVYSRPERIASDGMSVNPQRSAILPPATR